MWNGKTVRAILVMLALGMNIVPAQTPAPSQSARLQQISRELDVSCAKIARRFAARDPNLALRDVGECSYFAVMAHNDSATAEKMLGQIFDTQDMRPDSPAYGSLPWDIFSTNIKDPNSIEFGTHFWGPLLLGYGKSLSPGFVKEMRMHAAAALAALERHHPPVTYTNIYLMNTVATILIAQAVNSTTQGERGRQQLSDWMQYTGKNGIHEFDSSTYTAIDLSEVSIGARYVASPEEHAEITAALNYLWKDIALNVSPHIHKTLLGANSRDYDFLRGVGGTKLPEWASGLIDDADPPGVDPSKAGVLDYTRTSGFLIDADKLRRLIPDTRIITQRYSEDPNQIRYTYVTPGFAVGTASGDYGPQDKLFAMDFATEKDLPNIIIVPDKFDAPYGLIQTKDQSGHEKATHLLLHPIFLQKNGSVLALLNLDLAREKDLTSAATNLILPAKADEIRLNGKIIDVSKLDRTDAAPDSTVGVREGSTCFAARFVHVDAAGATSPVFQIRSDPIGLSHGAIRFAAYHLQKPQFDLPKNLHVVLILETAPCPATGLAGFIDQVGGAKTVVEQKDGRIRVRASLAAGTFVIAAREDAHSASTLTIDDVTPQSAPLMFNGEAIPLLPTPSNP